jgi:hypothetical protein
MPLPRFVSPRKLLSARLQLSSKGGEGDFLKREDWMSALGCEIKVENVKWSVKESMEEISEGRWLEVEIVKAWRRLSLTEKLEVKPDWLFKSHSTKSSSTQTLFKILFCFFLSWKVRFHKAIYIHRALAILFKRLHSTSSQISSPTIANNNRILTSDSHNHNRETNSHPFLIVSATQSEIPSTTSLPPSQDAENLPSKDSKVP